VYSVDYSTYWLSTNVYCTLDTVTEITITTIKSDVYSALVKIKRTKIAHSFIFNKYFFTPTSVANLATNAQNVIQNKTLKQP